MVELTLVEKIEIMDKAINELEAGNSELAEELYKKIPLDLPFAYIITRQKGRYYLENNNYILSEQIKQDLVDLFDK